MSSAEAIIYIDSMAHPLIRVRIFKGAHRVALYYQAFLRCIAEMVTRVKRIVINVLAIYNIARNV